ncbi:hypothetical protein OE88DRAFT_1663569 [Heliocybe sulcata]|uniref:Uncharacterized protein n=1 Tax=Heliocybe sulcata TaxID=5364 RepID=A0A5C3MUI6_9AGAM|nr:hypothetical protein OE88DRAFT_1663569 [Heliocybe sulcata]
MAQTQPTPMATDAVLRPTTVGNATRIWEPNLHWGLFSQCSVWNPRVRCVDVWECIQAHDSRMGSEPPNPQYWRYIARR